MMLRTPGLGNALFASLSLVALAFSWADADAQKAPATVKVQLGFPRSATTVSSPAPASSCLAEARVFGQGGRYPASICVNSNPSGIVISFTSNNPALRVDTAWSPATPSPLNCVRVPSDLTPMLALWVWTRSDSSTVITKVECDITPALLYASSVENNAPATTPKGATYIGSVAVPWTLISMSPNDTSLVVTLVAGAAQKHACLRLKVFGIGGKNVSPSNISVQQAPFVQLVTPQPSPGLTPAAMPPIRELGADFVYYPDRFNFGSGTFAQNAALSAVQSNLSQSAASAPFPIPTGTTLPASATLQTRMAPLLSFPASSGSLDQALKGITDTTPFAAARVSSLSAGFAYGYEGPSVAGAAFFGNSPPTGFYEAYAASVTVNNATPEPVEPSEVVARESANNATPEPSEVVARESAVPSPGPVASILQITPSQAAAAFAAGGSVLVDAPANRLPTTISFLDAITQTRSPITGTNLKSIEAVAASSSIYANNCSGDNYCSENLRLYGGFSTVPTASTSAALVGENGAFTWAKGGGNASFTQLSETLAYQQNDAFYSPPTGLTTAYSALSGAVGHITLSSAVIKGRALITDLLSYRLTNVYGDLAETVGATLTVPAFNVLGIKGGFTNGTITDHIALLAQGFDRGYSSFGKPGAVATPGAILPQNTYFYSLVTPWLSDGVNDWQASVGRVAGNTPNCGVPAPVGTSTLPPNCNGATFGQQWAYALFERNKYFQTGFETSPDIGGQSAVNAAGSRYQSSFNSTPTSFTAFFVSKMACAPISAVATNAAYIQNVPLPQKGSTVSAEADLPFGFLDVGVGYFNSIVADAPTLNQRGAFAVLKIAAAQSHPCLHPHR